MRVVAVVVAIAAAGCPGFHPAPLPGAPADATFVDVDGVHVHYRAQGQGPAVVLLHGYGGSMQHWAGVAPRLALQHRVISIDLKGFGWTSRPDGDYSPAAQAQLVWHVLDRLGIEDVAIVGHSWGSSVALAMALAQPTRTRRVALYSAYVYDEQVPSFFRWAQVSGLGEVLFELFYKQRIEDRAPLAYFDERWVTQDRIDRVHADLDLPGTTAAALAVARGHHFAALHHALHNFTKPILLLWGNDDQVTPIRFGHRLVHEVANAELKTYARCGHFPMVEAYAPSTRDLVEFLAKDRSPTKSENPDQTGELTPAPAPSSPATHDSNRPGGATTGGGASPGATGGSSSLIPAGCSTAKAAEAAEAERERSIHARAPGRIVCANQMRRVSPGPIQPFRSDLAVLADLAVGLSAGRRDPPGGGAGGGATGGNDLTIPPEPPAVPEAVMDLLPVGADLAAIGAELTPRLYAAPREHNELVAHGLLRLREAALYNLDLDRGLDSTGQPIFPVPLSGGQMLHTGDLRARTDLAFYARGVGVAVKARIDWLDNVALGGSPDLAGGSPATSGGQRPSYVVIKRAWGEALTPIGTLAGGRMGAHFGLGIAANGGDCEDCDHGDAADRLAFVSPLAGHFVAIAHDFTSRGPFTTSRDGGHPVELEPTSATASDTLAILNTQSPATLARHAAAGRTSIEYAAYVTRRTQDRDVPASYLPTAVAPTTFTNNDLVARGFSAIATGGWLRFSGAAFRIEAEVAYLNARVEQPSLIPGAEITEPVTSSQLGAALESAVALGASQLGLDAGYASGDDAPGFGAFPRPGQTATMPGAFDGPQANPPRDRTVDNFRFHPDFHIDQILFREIIGTITDAVYVRPHARATLLTVGTGKLELIGAVIASWAVQPTSTPSGQRALGVELDPELRYASRDGFLINLAYGVLFPGAGFDGTSLPARPAQAARLRLGFAF